MSRKSVTSTTNSWPCSRSKSKTPWRPKPRTPEISIRSAGIGPPGVVVALARLVLGVVLVVVVVAGHDRRGVVDLDAPAPGRTPQDLGADRLCSDEALAV